ncbi:MAG: TonB-dependent receptor [Sphingobium sp.]
MRSTLKILGASLLAARALTGTAAFAQSETGAATPTRSPMADSGQVQEIIVSARRRNESIQSTPVAVTAISPVMLENKASLSITDLQGTAPSVLITTQSTGASAANISIRGIAFADIDKSFDPAVGVMIDGVYIGTSTGQLLDFFDIDSIEILRGPQGTLFGRNTIGGVVNVRRSKPTGEWGGKIEASYASFNTIALRSVLNVPVVEGLLAAKVFEFHQQTDGFYRSATTGQRIGGNNQENFGASFLLTPSSSFDALLTVEQQDQKFNPTQASLTATGDVFCDAMPVGACDRNNTSDLYTVYRAQDYYPANYRARASTLEANWDLDVVKLTSVTSYRESREFQQQDFGTAGVYVGTRRQRYHQFSQELRASGNLFDGFDYVVGAYYFSSKYHLLDNTVIFGADTGTMDITGKSRSMAAFADLNWEFAPRLRLSGGGRITHDRKQNIVPALFDGAATYKQSKFTPKISLDWRPTNDLMLYGTWSQGYRSGGFSGRGATLFSATTPYRPETVSMFEGGIKSEFFDRKVALNIAAYITDYKNMQQNTTLTRDGGNGNETVVVNAAGAKIKGVEADLTARPFAGLTLRSSAGYTDAKFKGFLANQPVFGTLRTFDFSNVNLIYAPKITASFNADYEVPLGEKSKLTVSGGYRYISRYDQQVAADLATPIPASGIITVERNDPRLRSDRQNLLDASIMLVFPMNESGAKAKFSVFARNLLDDRGTATAFTVAAYPELWAFAAAREPRVFGVSFGAEF